MFSVITQSIKNIGNSIFPKPSSSITSIDESHSNEFDERSNWHQNSWNGIPLPAGYLNDQNKTIYRNNSRKEIVRGRVIKHVPNGIIVLIPSGEAGLVMHSELDWSPKRGRKYFPVDSEHDVMILSRPYNNRLYLSIREVKFPEYFKESLHDFPIGKMMICRISAVKDYGFFVTVKPNIDIFFHKSIVEKFTNFNLNDLVEIKVTGYDFERHRLHADLI